MRRREFFAYTAPSVIVMVGLMIVPLLFTAYLSLTRYSYGDTPVWIGLQNYVTIFADRRFWNSVGFTLFLICCSIPLEVAIGFGAALLLDRASRRVQGFVITCALLPAIVTPVVGTLVFSWLFQDRWGFYSWLLSLVGVHIQWFADAPAARALLVIHSIWQSTGFVFLILYAGLQALSREMLEAAAIDGASFAQRVWYVIVPSLAPLFIFVLMVRVMDLYRVFDSVFIMTRGGPGSATESVTFYNYAVAFTQFRLGFGGAVSMLTVVGIFILLAPFLYRSYRLQTAAA